METNINSSYLITIGTLIGYERKMKCKALAGTKEKEAYRQIPFCEGICCVQTYRNMEKAILEVKEPVYKKLLNKLGYHLKYDDTLYKDINYRLRNLNDAIEKYDLDSVFLVIEKLNETIPNDKQDIYYTYLKRIVNVIYQYYKSNEFPNIDDVNMMKYVYVGFPSYLRDIMIDVLYKYAVLNIIDDKKYIEYVSSLKLFTSKFVPNEIDYLQYLCYQLNYDKFYENIGSLIKALKSRKLYIRLLDIYDLKIIADLNTSPTKIRKDIEECTLNVEEVLKKLHIHDVNEISSKTLKTKFSQHYYNLGYTLMMTKNYRDAIDAFEKSLSLDDIFCYSSKVLLFNCYDRLCYSESCYEKYINEDENESINQAFIVYQYYKYKYENKNARSRLKYIKKHIIDNMNHDDSILIKILFFEINSLAKETANYQILQEFVEKMGIVD